MPEHFKHWLRQKQSKIQVSIEGMDAESLLTDAEREIDECMEITVCKSRKLCIEKAAFNGVRKINEFMASGAHFVPPYLEYSAQRVIDAASANFQSLQGSTDNPFAENPFAYIIYLEKVKEALPDCQECDFDAISEIVSILQGIEQQSYNEPIRQAREAMGGNIFADGTVQEIFDGALSRLTDEINGAQERMSKLLANDKERYERWWQMNMSFLHSP